MAQKTVNIIAILYIVLFLYSGINKLMDFDIFKEQIATSPLFASMASYVAFALPMIEIVTAILLFFPRYRFIGLTIALALMIVFTIYIIYILNTNDRLPCSCGGVIELLSWNGHLIFNAVFILLAAIGLILNKDKELTQYGQDHQHYHKQ